MRFLFLAGIRNGNSLNVILISRITRKCLYSLLRSWFSLFFFFFFNANKGSTQDKWELRIWEVLNSYWDHNSGRLPLLVSSPQQQRPAFWHSLNFISRVWNMDLEGHMLKPQAI